MNKMWQKKSDTHIAIVAIYDIIVMPYCSFMQLDLRNLDFLFWWKFDMGRESLLSDDIRFYLKNYISINI